MCRWTILTRPSSDSEGLGTRLGGFIKKDHLASFWKKIRYYKVNTEKVKTPAVTRSQTQDIWLVQPVFCHWATTTTSTHIAHNNDKWSLCRFASARLHCAECHLLVCAGVLPPQKDPPHQGGHSSHPCFAVGYFVDETQLPVQDRTTTDHGELCFITLHASCSKHRSTELPLRAMFTHAV